MALTLLDKIFSEVLDAAADKLAPHGFTRRSLVFRVLRYGNCGIVEFQRSVKTTKDKILFTINVGTICGELLDAGSHDISKAKVTDAHVSQRIGAFLPGRPDKWWEIIATSNGASLGQEVSELIIDKCVPFIHEFIQTDAMIALWESGECPGLTDFQRIRFLTKLKEERSRHSPPP
jgi:hypothetical protein